MTADPRSVVRTQSPWRHPPGKSSKYTARSRDPSGSFQKDTGIDGIVLVTTSSPTSSTISLPCSSYAATAAPSERHDSSPSHTGTSGEAPRNAVQTSVPPETEQICTGPTSSTIHRNPSTDSGAPVDPMARMADRSCSAAGRIFCFMQLCTNGAEVPKYVIRCWAASRHNVLRSGCPGLPSNSTTVLPTSKPDTRKFHIIHPVVVNQKNRSPGPRSSANAICLRCSTTIPPCPCTMPFGRPVVPDEYSTHSGCS